MSDWQVVGRQRYLVAGDMIRWEVLADVTRAEIAKIFYSAAAVQAEYGYALFFISAKASWAFPPEARQFLAQFHREHKAVGASAIVGANPTMTIFIDLVLRAVALVSGRRPTVRFFRLDDEALLWLQEQRARFKKGLLTS